jgi:hypothetical protein
MVANNNNDNIFSILREDKKRKNIYWLEECKRKVLIPLLNLGKKALE